MNMAMRDLLLHQADSAKVDIPAGEKTDLQAQFEQLVQTVWSQLGLSPKQLADSTPAQAARGKLVAARMDSLIARIMAGEATPIGIPPVLESGLGEKWEVSISSAGIERAVQAALAARTAADSAQMARPSQVPLPGTGGQTPPPSGQTPPSTKPPGSGK
jgi:hypothetical protein